MSTQIVAGYSVCQLCALNFTHNVGSYTQRLIAGEKLPEGKNTHRKPLLPDLGVARCYLPFVCPAMNMDTVKYNKFL